MTDTSMTDVHNGLTDELRSRDDIIVCRGVDKWFGDFQALNDIDWKAKGKTMSVRINGLDTHYMYRDVVDVVEQAGDKLDTILVPKVGVPADLYMVEAMVNQIEMGAQREPHVQLEALIETALGMANVE